MRPTAGTNAELAKVGETQIRPKASSGIAAINHVGGGSIDNQYIKAGIFQGLRPFSRFIIYTYSCCNPQAYIIIFTSIWKLLFFLYILHSN